MANPFLAEIRIFGFNFAPKGWAFCDGQILPLSQNTALFALLGTNYGGDGKSTFGLPNLQGLAPMSFGQGPGLSQRVLGEIGGFQFVTLLETEMAAHNHSPRGASGTNGVPTSSNSSTPAGNTWGGGSHGHAAALYAQAGSNMVAMAQNALPFSGGGVPHNNMSPYLALNFCIALQGVFPTRS